MSALRLGSGAVGYADGAGRADVHMVHCCADAGLESVHVLHIHGPENPCAGADGCPYAGAGAAP